MKSRVCWTGSYPYGSMYRLVCNSLCFRYGVLFSCLFETNRKWQQKHATRKTEQNNSIKCLNLASQETPELCLTGQISPLLYKIINHLSSYSCCCAKIPLQKEPSFGWPFSRVQPILVAAHADYTVCHQEVEREVNGIAQSAFSFLCCLGPYLKEWCQL